MLKAAKAYLSTQVSTATQGDVLLLLYDTAIKHIKQAKDKMVERDFAAGIEARLHHKDFGLVLEAARQSGVPVPLTAAVAQQLNSLMAQGWGGDDTASLLRVLEVNS